MDVDFLVKEEEKRGWMISLGRPRLKVCNLIRPPLKLFSFFFSRPNRKFNFDYSFGNSIDKN